ncbi:MAG: STAS/SEC14 domain-containing protein [Arenicellales bacterium]
MAAVTDNSFLAVMPKIADHFVKAEVKHFDYEEKTSAMKSLTEL